MSRESSSNSRSIGGKRRRITLQKKGMSKTKYHLVERLAASGHQRSSSMERFVRTLLNDDQNGGTT